MNPGERASTATQFGVADAQVERDYLKHSASSATRGIRLHK